MITDAKIMIVILGKVNLCEHGQWIMNTEEKELENCEPSQPVTIGKKELNKVRADPHH